MLMLKITLSYYVACSKITTFFWHPESLDLQIEARKFDL